MTFNGSGADGLFAPPQRRARAAHARRRQHRQDLDDLDQIDIAALGGADRLDVNDLSATDLRAVSADLPTARGRSSASAVRTAAM